MPDPTLGCRCMSGLVYNGASGQCQNSNQASMCAAGQYFDMINNLCFPLPIICPPSSWVDATLGCRCFPSQTYNGATNQCENYNQPSLCSAGQFFDTRSNSCYNIPPSCPAGAQVDLTLGCLCFQGQTYMAPTGQCVPL
ncbi:hypothetical protein EGW08_007439 [Elysia chlorotica]|uniref:EB domain-containing protein n=1 Tax=Elysia chlorotica TaxID=188477 RepID=A0A433TTD1_ELYCH|nr:hypothetical protein EGW08_007439 [Elysia chlorotica]